VSRLNLEQTVRICCRDKVTHGAQKWVEVRGRELKGGVFAVTKNGGVMGLTHIKTGSLVQNRVPSLAAAELASKRLMALDVDWGFDSLDAVKSFPDEIHEAIHEIRKDACNGITRPREGACTNTEK